jgi:polysaccharide biosynthesis transport protein
MNATEANSLSRNLDAAAILRGIWRRHKTLVAVIFLMIAGPLLLLVYFTSQPLFVSKATISIEPSALALAQIPFLKDPPGRNTMGTHMVLLKSRSLGETVMDSLPRDSVEELLTAAQYTDYWLLLRNTINRWLGRPIILLSPREQALTELRMARMEFLPLREAENIYVITSTATKPRVAMDLVNTYIQVLQGRTRTADREDSRRTREFLELQYQQTKENLARDEQALAKFQLQTGRTRSQAQTELDMVRLAQLENTLSETQASREVLSARIETTRRSVEQLGTTEHGAAREKSGRDGSEGPTGSGMAENQARLVTFKAAQEQLGKLETRLSNLLERYTDAHPSVQSARDETIRQRARVAELARQLPAAPSPKEAATPPTDRSDLQGQLATFQRELDTLRAKEETLKLQIGRLRPSLKALSQGEIEFANLSRSVEANRSLLAVFSDKLAVLKIRDQVDSGVIRTVDPASLPYQTSGSKTQKLMLMVLGLAGGMAFGVAFSIEYWRQPVETESDVLKATGLSVLGSVGVIETFPTSGKHRRGTHPVALSVQTAGTTVAQQGAIHIELYRAIRANVETERLKSPFKSIMVTSPAPHEGKSTTILNLAHVFQEFGRRVLVVEADIRRPSLSSALGLTSKPGMVDFLNGTATFEQVCRPLPSGVILIPAQVARGDAASLLASPRFRELLARSADQFDLILVDCAPVLAVPDNLLLATVIDRVIMVAKATGTSARDLRKAQREIERAGGRILGVVLNQANPRDVSYYHPRYRKYYTSAAGKPGEETSGRRPSSSRASGNKT